MNSIILDILTFNTLLSAVLVINSVNPIYSVIFLISVFVNAALFLILKGIGFIGISYLIIYVGAITVLFLFVIMMINVKLTDIIETGKQYTKNLPLIYAIALLFSYEALQILPFTLNNVSGLSQIGEFFNNLNAFFYSQSLSFSGLNDISVSVFKTFDSSIADQTFVNFLQIEAIGERLYCLEAIELLILSMILLLSMVCPIFISRKSNKK